MLGWWLISIGSVAASVGFTLLGMAMSYISPDPSATRNWAILTVVGLVVLVVGFAMNRKSDPVDPSMR